MIGMSERGPRAIITGAVAFLALCGCASLNSFSKFYVPFRDSASLHGKPWIEPASGKPAIYAYSGDPEVDNLRAAEAGYIPIGFSEFYGPPATMAKREALAQARRLGASLVLIRPQYRRAGFGAAPWNRSTPTRPSAVPALNDTMATFWVRADTSKLRFGAQTVELTQAQREALKRSAGVLVTVVVRGTPAYDAQILRGDVILKVDGENVMDPRGFESQLTRFQGQRVDLEILRDGVPRTVSVPLKRP